MVRGKVAGVARACAGEEHSRMMARGRGMEEAEGEREEREESAAQGVVSVYEKRCWGHQSCQS